MNFMLSDDEERFRKEVRAFIKKELTEEVIKEAESGLGPGVHSTKFLRKLGERGWLLPTLPREYDGMGGTYVQRFIVWDELLYHRAVEPLVPPNEGIVAPTLMLYGNEEQKRKYVVGIARHEIEFCAGYTEPQAGSDLGAVEMTAIEDGDEYVISGQKVFNTQCHHADYHWIIAKTDRSAPRYKNLSLFIVDIHSPGITIRPLWVMDGERTNEVFYDNVRVPKANMVGEKNRGFYYLMTALTFERNFAPGGLRRDFEELITYVKETKRGGRALAEDPQVRQELAELQIELEACHLLGYRVAWMADQGIVPSAEAPMAKLFGTELMQRLANTGLRIMGLSGQLREESPWAPLEGRFERLYRHGARRTIGAGTSEIMRNTIAIRGLGLRG